MTGRLGRSVVALGLFAAAGSAGSSSRQSQPLLPESCEAAAVGAGWAGVYYAFRLAEAGQRVCIFEASDRVGGRTYSHTVKVGARQENFTLDVGAYRFSPDMHLPGDVILRVLKLPVACYEPSCEPANKDFPPPFRFNYTAPLMRIVNSEGMPAGYVTAIHALLGRILAAGGQLFMESRLTDLVPLTPGSGVRLVFGDQKVMVKQVLLNLPRNSLVQLPSLRAATPSRTAKMQECVKFDIPASFFPKGQKMELGRSLTKAYAFYEDAWWHTLLNKIEGQWPENAFLPLKTPEDVPIGIHFNDGPVRCEAPGKSCRGFLEVFYATALETFYEDLRPDAMHPLGELSAEEDKTGQLARLHYAVMDATKELFEAKGVERPTVPPTRLIVGVWDRQGQGYTAPTKVYYSTAEDVPGGPDPLEKACGVPGLTEAEYRQSILSPTGQLDVLVANNDWVAQRFEDMFGDWAEESLLQVERGLMQRGMPRPAWLEESYYQEKVAPYAGCGVECAEKIVV